MSEQQQRGVVEPYEGAKAEAMLRGYDARWGGEALTVLAVEAEFRAPVVNPATGAASRTWGLGGKIDAIVREEATGRVLVVEHKTSSDDITPGSEYLRRLRMDGQVSIYFDGAAALGHTPDACLYDVLGKPGLRPSQVPVLDEQGVKIVLDAAGVRVRTKDGKKFRETGDTASGYVLQTRVETVEEYYGRVASSIAMDPNGYYVRAEVVRLDGELDDARFDVWQIGAQLREAANAGRHPRNPDACSRWGRTCEFFDVCTGAGSVDDPTRFRVETAAHAELAADATDALPLLTASRLTCARACQRMHKLRYLDGVRPAIEAEALRFGTLIHRGLEAWWKAQGDDRLPAALAAIYAPTV